MAATLQAPQVLERHFLELRCGLLDMAAALDRLERAAGYDTVKTDPRLKRVREALKILDSAGTNRAERIQMLFSDAYEAGWNASGVES